MIEIIGGNLIYIWYYSTLMLYQIAPYWLLGVLAGSLISTLGRDRLHSALFSMRVHRFGVFGVFIASLLGIAFPLGIYGAIPVMISLHRDGVEDDLIVAFAMSSSLLNPQLLFYSAALGRTMLIIRFLSCLICGVIAGLLVRYLYGPRGFFDISTLLDCVDRNSRASLRFLRSVLVSLRKTGKGLIFGILLSALFQLYVPRDSFAALFGDHRAIGVLLSATLGVPLYVCGGGTIPLIIEWLDKGMSVGAATAFMIVGPAMRFTTLGIIKALLDLRRFLLYIIYVLLFATITGLLINAYVGL